MRKLLWCLFQLAIIVPITWLGFILANEPPKSPEIAHLATGQIVLYSLLIGVWFAAAATLILGKIFEAFTAVDDTPAAHGQARLPKPAAGRLAATKAGFLDRPGPALTLRRGRLH